MRFLLFFLTVCLCVAPSAFCAEETSFDSFMKSREVLATLYFQANSDALSRNEQEIIAKTISQLRMMQKDGRMIRVEGFSSPEGNDEENLRLSFFRARTVADLLKSRGLPAKVAITGYGGLRTESDDPAKDRRVEIASYLKPVGLKKIKIVEKKKMLAPMSAESISQVEPQTELVIDALAIEQAIMEKMGAGPTTPLGSVSQVSNDF